MKSIFSLRPCRSCLKLSLAKSHVQRSQTLSAFLLAVLASFSACSGFALTITGVVTNGTTSRPAAGDSVVLIALSQQMQEIAHAKTGPDGRFSIDSPDPGMHLIRVDHQGAAYFQPAPPNTPSVNVEVFDVSPAVAGVTTEANVLRVETDQQGLHVTQSIFVKNNSQPPRTQFSNHSYEIYIPPNAQIEGAAAMGPGGMPVQSSPMPLHEKGLYAFVFPLRPGETQFQLSYRLPYSGSFVFAPRLATPESNFVVMLPMSMTFKAGPKTSFQPIDQPAGAQTYLARNVTPQQPLSFTVSGSGQMPRDTQTAGNQADQGQPQAATGDTRPGIGLGNPIDTPDPLNKYKWWILGGLGLLFAAAAGFLLRKPVGTAPPPQLAVAPELPGYVSGPGVGGLAPEPATETSLLAALKNELFAIETDHIQGRLSDSEYVELKTAFELVLRRALRRQPAEQLTL